MADATDLKSVPAKAGYGFESHHRHPLKSDFTRENRSIWQFRRLRMVAIETQELTSCFVNYSPTARLGLHTGLSSAGVGPETTSAVLDTFGPQAQPS
jgi:hypothetical protein